MNNILTFFVIVYLILGHLVFCKTYSANVLNIKIETLVVKIKVWFLFLFIWIFIVPPLSRLIKNKDKK